MQTEILLSTHGKTDQTIGHVIEQYIRESRVDYRLTRPALQNPSEQITAPEDAIQIDLIPELPSCGGNENIVTAMDVVPRFLFAYPTSSPDAETIDDSKSNNLHYD